MSSRELREACGFIEDGEFFSYQQKDYLFLAWSKLKVDEDLPDDESYVKILEERFLSAGGTLTHPD